MKNFVVLLLVVIISIVSSKPIEEHGGQLNNIHEEWIRPKRQLPDEIALNKQFFEDIFQSSRISRDTSDGDVAPTIALHDLISSVEHTLIHSAQNLALANITANLTSTNAETNSSSISHVEEVALPISVPTPEPKADELITESDDEATTTAEDLIRNLRSEDESGSGHKENDSETIQPIENSNLGILFPIALNPSANISRVVVADEPQEDVPSVTEETKQEADPANITVLHTINATQVIPTSESDVVHVHQQQITFFSANAGVFPNIHAIKAEDLATVTQALQGTTAQSEDCSGEETSEESAETASEEDSSSDSSSEEHGKVKKRECIVKSSSSISTAKTTAATTLTTTESTTPSAEAVKKSKTEELKEQIAEVEADPVILTQGI